MKVLHVLANPKPMEEANSRQLSREFFLALRQVCPSAVVTTVDLSEDPPPFYDYATYRYYWYPVFNPAYKPSDQEKAAVKYAERHCQAFKDHDVLAITTPMWNFSLPGVLKAWIDQVLMPRVTFDIGPGGVKALHRIRKVVLLASSGGAYGEGDPRDCLRSEIKAAFGFVQITDIEVAWAQGQNLFFFKDHAERKAAALQQAAELGRKIGQMKG